MSIIQAHNVEKSFQGKVILSEISFAIDAGDKIGLIGRNGSGKTTLLNLLTGTLEADQGQIHRAQTLLVAMLGQRPTEDFERGFKILEKPEFVRTKQRLSHIQEKMEQETGESLELLVSEYSELQHLLETKGAYDYEARLSKNLSGLGLSEQQMNQPYDTLSGGEQMRVALGRLLLEPSDLLFLDEPTNHLDHDGLLWLSGYLASRRSGLIVISHDRWFLDQVCDRIFELENRKLYTYRGNYSASRQQKQEREELLHQTLGRLEERIKREEEVTQTMLSHRKMKSYHSREKVVKKLKNEMKGLEEKKNPERRMSFSFLPENSKQDKNRALVEASELSLSYDRPLFSDVSFTLCASDKIALLGPNGCGKTSLLRILIGEVEPDEGTIRLYGDPSIAFMGQIVEFQDDELTVYEHLASSYHETETAIRKRLARFGFRDESMIKKLRSLSGGERHRLHLCTLLEEKPDILILDEPTNHLDIDSRQLLEEALTDFYGAVVAVSHDRYFVDAVSDSVLGFVEEAIIPFDDYESWYAQHSEKPTAEEITKIHPPNAVPVIGAAELRRQRAQQRERISRVKNDIEKLEHERTVFESKDSREHEASDYERYAEVTETLDDLYLEYFELELEEE